MLLRHILPDDPHRRQLSPHWLECNSQYCDLCEDLQVLPSPDIGCEVAASSIGARSGTIEIKLIPAYPSLLGAIEIGIPRIPQCFGGSEKSLGRRTNPG